MKTALKILKEARSIIKDPKHWTTGHFAKTETGRSVPALHSRATCWCAVGATQKAANVTHLGYSMSEALAQHEDYNVAMRMLCATANVEYGISPAEVNDLKGHAEVLKLFDEAITKLEYTKN